MDGIGFNLCFCLALMGLFVLVWCRNSEWVTVPAANVNDITESRVKLALSAVDRSHTFCAV